MRIIGRIGCLSIIVLMSTFFIYFLAVKGFFELDPISPYRANDICFRRDYPGSTERYTEFTPVRCSDSKVILGLSIGADYGSLSFTDIDNDGHPEMIVQSSRFRCRYSTMACYDTWRFVAKVCTTCTSVLTVIEQVYLPELSATSSY